MGNRTMFRNWNIRGGVNYLEHVNPHDYVRSGSAILRMEQVILKFREYGQTPSVYLFRLGLGPEMLVFTIISHFALKKEIKIHHITILKIF